MFIGLGSTGFAVAHGTNGGNGSVSQGMSFHSRVPKPRITPQRSVQTLLRADEACLEAGDYNVE
jgi:hypothetical protein